MEGQFIQEINNFISMKRLEDALSSVRRSIMKERDEDCFLKEAYLLFNMYSFRQCGELCMERLSEKEDFDFRLLLRACENICRKRSYMLSAIGKYQPAPADSVFSSAGALLAVFCDIKEAIHYLKIRLSVDNDPKIRYLLAASYRLAGKLQEALNILEPIASVYAPAASLRAKMRFELGCLSDKSKSGSERIASAALSNPDGEDLLARGFWAVAEKNYQDAFKYFSEALKVAPTLYIVWYYVGKLQYFCGAKEKAYQCFNRFLELFPGSSGYYRAQITSYGSKMPPESLADAYHKWIGYFPSDPTSWIAYMGYLAQINDSYSVQLIASEILDNYYNEGFLNSNSAYGNVVEGILRLYSGRITSAAESFSRAAKSEGQRILAYIGLGKACEMQGRFADAADYYGKIAEVPKAKYVSAYLMTDIFLKRKEYKKAFETVGGILEKFPSSAIACCKKAEVFFESSDLKGFKKYVSSLDMNKAGSPRLYVLKAIAALKDLKVAEALKELQTGLKRWPDSWVLERNLALILCRMDRYEEAASILDKVSHWRLFPEEQLIRAGWMLHLKDYGKSLEHLENFVGLRPFDFRGWHLMGIVLDHLGSPDASRMAFEKARYMSGDGLYYRQNLAIACARAGEYGEALKWAEPATSRERQDSQYSLFCGWLLTMAGRREEAAPLVDRLAKSDPESVPVRLLKARLEFDGGNVQGAGEIVEQAMALEPENADLWYNKAFLALHRNDQVEAEAAIAKAIEYNPTHYQAWLAKAVLSWIKHSESEAVEAVKGAKALNNPHFKSWLKQASVSKDPLTTISFLNRLAMPFYMPEIFSISYDDPLNMFALEKLDEVFV